MVKFYRTEEFKGPLMQISYAFNMFTPREKTRDNGDKFKSYECTLIMPKSGDWSSITQGVKDCVVGQWGEKALEKLKSGLIRSPILDGAGKEAHNKTTGELNAGMGPDVQFIRTQANEDYPPQVFDAQMKRCSVLFPKSPYLLLKAEDCPSGSWGYPVLNVWAWHNAKNGDGVSFGISMFHTIKVAEGDEILGGGGRADPGKFFEAVKTDGDAGGKPASAASMFD